MFPVLRNLQSAVRFSVTPRRSYYGYYGGPREQLSIMETWAHGLFVVSGVLFVPCWVLAHIKEYRGIDKPKES
ncbi:hypothetical protein X975_23746, partial [Stegodyphus mimosarum]